VADNEPRGPLMAIAGLVLYPFMVEGDGEDIRIRHLEQH
tara:strand:- start:296 stop:412 length:117 start_codon:yes stop_codon:yes gene_type:complete